MPFSDPDPGFKVSVYLEVEYVKNDAFQGQSYQRTSKGNHTQCIDWYNFQ